MTDAPLPRASARQRTRSKRRRASASGSGLTEAGDQPVIARVQAVQQGLVAHGQMVAGLAEAGTAEMGDEQPRHRDMAPAEMAGAQAKVVFLTVALGEDFGTEAAHGVDAVAAQIEAEAHADRDIDEILLVGAAGGGVQPDRGGEVGDGIAARRAGVAQDAGVVREWGGGADVGRGAAGVAQAFQPAGRHQRVAVEEDHVVAFGGGDAVIGAGGEALVARVPHDLHAARCRQRVQSVPQLGLGRGVVHHDDPVRWAEGGKDAVKAGQDGGGLAVDRHDDSYRAIRLRDGGGRPVPARGGPAWANSAWANGAWANGARANGACANSACANGARANGEAISAGSAGGANGAKRPGADERFGVGERYRASAAAAAVADFAFGIGIERAAQQIPPITPQHMQWPRKPGDGIGRDGEAARARQRAGVLHDRRQVRGDDPQRVAAGITTDQQLRIGIRVARVPGPAAQAAVVRLDEAGDTADRGDLDRTAEQLPAPKRHRDLARPGPGARQRGRGYALGVKLDLGGAGDGGADNELPVAGQPAPPGGAGTAEDHIGQGVAGVAPCGLQRVARQGGGEGGGGASGVVRAEAGRRQAKPGLANVAHFGDGAEQGFCARIVMTQAGAGERQRQRAVCRRQAMGAIQPADRFGGVARDQRMATPQQGVAGKGRGIAARGGGCGTLVRRRG